MRNISQKIKNLPELAVIADNLKREGKTVVQCHGCFDLVHLGHIRHFEAAKKEGDVLIVSLVDDRHINKGPGRPFFSVHERVASVAALECVDYVVISPTYGPWESIKAIKPDLYFKGQEYEKDVNNPSADIYKDAEAVRSVGGEICFTHEPVFSSTNLLKNHFGAYSDDVKNFLNDFARRYPAEEVIGRLKQLKNMRVLLIGDAVIDEYHYCEPLGKSGKENLVAMKYVSDESFVGGIFACANHLAGFCENVELATVLGAKDSREEFIRKNLKPNIRSRFFYRDDAPTSVKRRFVEPAFINKLFSIYYFNDEELPESVSREVAAFLEKNLPDYDLVVVLDYAHGFLNAELIKTICAGAKFLAVNTQTNAANFGYNLITKYPRADYVCIDWQEARLALGRKDLPVKEMLAELADKTGAQKIIVTMGHQGSAAYDAAKGYSSIPVLSQKVIDRMGAGDAFFAVSAPCVAAGYQLSEAAFIGNAAGALAVGIVGNKSSVEPEKLHQFIKTLLK